MDVQAENANTHPIKTPVVTPGFHFIPRRSAISTSLLRWSGESSIPLV